MYATPKGCDSPSVTMEKGRYRMRAPPTPLRSSTVRQPRPRKTQGISSNMAAALVALLTFACLASFSFAYYLFTTRWSANTPLRDPSDVENLQVVPFDSFMTSPREYPPSEKFLSYLPHSGLHNQRIALENAIILGALTNRTVLVPPIRLGNTPLRYANSDSLQQILAISGKAGLRHCSQIRSQFLPPECLSYFCYTHVSPAWLFNLTGINGFPPLVYLDDLSSASMRDRLGLAPSDIFTLRDLSRYHYRFLDTISDLPFLQHKYAESIYISDLARYSHRLIEVGTLFGSSRLRLRVEDNKRLRTHIRQSMDFFSPQLVETADAIEKALGGRYLGAHIRLGDGPFKVNGEATLRQVWWKLVHEILRFNVSEAEKTFQVFWTPSSVTVPRSLSDLSLGGRCRSHTSIETSGLNAVLFISTDVANPREDPSFSGFLRTFPCAFFLADFAVHIQRLDSLRNEYDWAVMRPFLLPLLDAMVVGRAQVVAGTEGSTFSRFIEDVVWRRRQGLDIKERG